MTDIQQAQMGKLFIIDELWKQT